MKRTVLALLSLAAFLSAFSACKDETDASLPSVTEEILDDCYMTVSLDREDYVIGDVVVVTAVVENKSDSEISLHDEDRYVFVEDGSYGGDYSNSASRIISVVFEEGGLARKDLLPSRDYTETEIEDSTLEKNEKISRTVEIFLDGTSRYSAPAMGADWTVRAGVGIYSENGDYEHKSVEIDVPHERGENEPYSAADSDGCVLTAVLEKSYYKAIETVCADITFTNGSDVPVTVLGLPDTEFDFNSDFSRNGYIKSELEGGFSSEYTAYKLLEPGESITLPVSFPLERSKLGTLLEYSPHSEYILSASVWYQPASGDDTSPRSIGIEMPVPHERVRTQLYKEKKGAYFSRLRATVDNEEYKVGDELPVTLEFFCIREDFYLLPVDETGKCFKVQLMSGERVVEEVMLTEDPGLMKEGTVLSAETVFDLSGMTSDEAWSVVFTVTSCAEKDMNGRGFEEHSVILDIPHMGYEQGEADE